MSDPDISVAVPCHNRALRLRWLLNALEEQTLERERWEVVVGHDSSGPETSELLRSHPLAVAGVVREVRLPPGSSGAGRNRNPAWRAARAPLVIFTDDDCRPPSDWLERALEAARRHPGAVVQGRTIADPVEAHLRVAPHSRTQYVDPPHPKGQACNIIYPRRLLEGLGGFDEDLLTGEDTDLLLRARKAGAAYVGAPEVLTFHAVTTPDLLACIRSTWRWRDEPELVRRHPEHRAEYPLRYFWKRTHSSLPLALAGAALAPRRPAALLLALPWVRALAQIRLDYGDSLRARARRLAEVPGRGLIAMAEFLVLAWASARRRTLLL